MSDEKRAVPTTAATVEVAGITTMQPEIFLATVSPHIVAQFTQTAIPLNFKNSAPLDINTLRKRAGDLGIRFNTADDKLLVSANRINPDAHVPIEKLPQDIKASLAALKPAARQFHGAKFSLAYFPFPSVASPCADKFGYMSPAAVRAATSLPVNVAMLALLDQLGTLMGDPGRDTGADSTIPAGFTYIGQFIDHDVTLDVSSSLDTATDANVVPNMRTPALDLDSLYGRGPALDAFLYNFPSVGPASAIKFQLGSNTPTGPGGPAGSAGNPAAMNAQTDFDVPRMHNPVNSAASTLTAIIGDPRNDENLIVTQFHQSMLRFHNKVVDLLLLVGFTGDIFVEAKRIVTHHYQWAVAHDFLGRVCGNAAVASAMGSVAAAPGSAFRMPVEFAVAAYRFGHSMVRSNYWINFNFINASLAEVFARNRKPNIPVQSNWVVDFNAFLTTGNVVPVNNKARKIDSVLASGLEALPGLSGMMAVLAMRNLRRGLALGLPSGQGMAGLFGIPPMSAAQITQGLPANEVAVLQSNGGLLLTKTPLWYYVLREAAVLQGGNQLGPVGGRIVAETFVRMLKRDVNSHLNVSGGFAPMLPSATAGDFTFADLVNFAGVTQP
jgi:hypothetical protein